MVGSASGFGIKTHIVATPFADIATTQVGNEPARSTPAKDFRASELPRELTAKQAKIGRQKLAKLFDTKTIDGGDSVLSRAMQPSTDNTSHHGLVDALFIGGNGGAHDALKDAIAEAVSSPDGKEASAHRTLLTLSLAGVCGDSKINRCPGEAIDVLACLRGMDLTGIVRGNAQMPTKSASSANSVNSADRANSPYPNKVQRAAWSMAYQLAASNSAAYDALNQASTTKIPDEHKRVMKNLMDSCHHMISLKQGGQDTNSDLSPASLKAEAERRKSLVGDAVRGNHAIVCSDDGPSKAWKALAQSDPKLAIASSAVRNGMYDDSKGSPFDKAAKRSQKLLVWKDRAIKRHQEFQLQPPAPASDGGSAPPPQRRGLDRLKTISSAVGAKVGREAANLIAPGYKKSPITPLLEQAEILKNARTNALDESRKVQTVLSQLRCAHKDALSALAGDLATQAQSEQDSAKEGGSPKSALNDCLVKIAILEVFEKRNVMHRVQGKPLSEGEKEMVNRRLAEFATGAGGWVGALEMEDRITRPPSAQGDTDAIMPAGPSNSRAVPGHVSVDLDDLKKSFKGLLDAPPGPGRESAVDLKPECMRDWSNDVRKSINSIGAAKGTKPPETADWNSMEGAFERWEGKLPEIEIPKFESESQFIDCVLKIKDGIDLASSAKGSAGWMAGLDSSVLSKALGGGNEKGAAALASQAAGLAAEVAVGGVAGPRLKAMGGREVFFNLDVGAQAVELSFGAQVKGIVEVGAYGRVGPNIEIEHGEKSYGLLAGGSAAISARYEETQPTDVVVVRMGGRTGRNREKEIGAENQKNIPPGMPGDPMRKDQFTPVLRAMLQPVSREDVARGITSPLHRAMLEDEHNEISITYQQRDDMPTRTGKITGSIGLGLMLRSGAGRAGVNVVDAKLDGIKAPPKMNVMKEKQGAVRYERTTEVTAVKGSLTTGLVAGSGTTEEAGLVVAGAPLSYTGDFANKSVTKRRHIVSENNDVQASSYTQIMHQSFDGFRDSVLSRLDEWADSVIRRRQLSLPPDLRCAMPPAGTAPASDPAYGAYLELHEQMKTEVRAYLKGQDEQRKELEKNGMPMTYSYSEWMTLKPDVAKEVNLRKSAAQAARQAGQTKDADALDEATNQMLRRQDAWSPTLMFPLKSVSRTVNTGLNFGVLSQKHQTAESTGLVGIDG